MKSFVLKWYPIILVHLHVIFNWVRISRRQQEALYSAHWPNNFIIRNSNPSKKTMSISFLLLRHNFFNLYVPNVLEHFLFE
jgi:hypothetical protein